MKLTALSFAAVTLAALAPAGAAIVVDAVHTWDRNSDPTSFDFSGSDMLVVVTTGEHHFGPGNLTADVSGITYNGAALTQAVSEATGGLSFGSTSDIWYLDEPGSFTGGGDILDVSHAGNNFVFTAIGLSGPFGVDFKAGSGVAVDGSYSGSVTTGGETFSFVVAAVGLGGNGNTGDTSNVDADSPLVELSSPEIGNNWAGHVTGGASLTGPSVATYSFTDGSPGTDISFVAAVFVPEPSSVALIGLAGLGLLRRRR